MTTRMRIDHLLVQRGLFESRAKAQAAIAAGSVTADGVPVRRASDTVAADAELEAAPAHPFVSRGGVKLAAALDQFGFDPRDCVCLDVGASTGGFTDCLLQRGARHVVALDVAYGELAMKLRDDPRVTVLERVNARALDPSALPYRPDLVAVDVSFISLAKVLPAVLACTGERFDALAMVKPQFEVGRKRVGKGGVVRDPALRRAALVTVAEAAQDAGAAVLAFASSGLPGPAGNRETFAWLAESGRPGAVHDLEAAAREVEP